MPALRFLLRYYPECSIRSLFAVVTFAGAALNICSGREIFNVINAFAQAHRQGIGRVYSTRSTVLMNAELERIPHRLLRIMNCRRDRRTLYQ